MEDYGFEFRYRNHHLSRSKHIDPSDMETGCGNSDNLFIFCSNCGVYMEFHEDGLMNGHWECPECGVKVREQTVYSQMNRECDDWYDKHDIDSGKWYR